ncbi:hypothetical protein NX059_007673 [Plenodomus lindquistii]|nr:hypothetical protein NX059_007673 [Plenodomus lindquistii]
MTNNSGASPGAARFQATRRHMRTDRRKLLKRVTMAPHIIWLLTKDDFFTFVCPNTVYGMFATLSGTVMIDSSQTAPQVLFRLPWVILFNWSNLLIFDLANQRLPSSADEDRLNKPWRPVPSGRMTSNHVRQAMLVAIPAVVALNYFILHTGTECAVLLILTWFYNDLEGGDEHWMLRNAIIAAAYWQYNVGSVKVAAFSSPRSLSTVGTVWTSVVSVIILTTMHVQDLKDQDGDRLKRRSTAPLVLGEYASRWTIAIPVLGWSLFCAYYWKMGGLAILPVSLGCTVAWRCVNLRNKHADRRTWELWALWTSALYAAPLLYSLRSPEQVIAEAR